MLKFRRGHERREEGVMRLPLPVLAVCGVLAGISAPAQQTSEATFPWCQKPADLATLTTKAEAGDSKAQLELGESKTFHGTGGERQQGVGWLRKAAAQGNARAECRLANALGEGIEIPRNSTEATKWFEKAAADGDADCEESLALDYRDGIGRKKDHAQYLRWLKAAADHGQSDAQVESGSALRRRQGFVPQDHEKAAEWYRKAAEHVLDIGGAQQGRNDLGFLYLDGNGSHKITFPPTCGLPFPNIPTT